MNAISTISSGSFALIAAFALGGLGLALHAPSAEEPGVCLISLEIEEESSSDCYYGSEFNGGPLLANQCISGPQEWTTEFELGDGCTWRGREVLIPEGDHFLYEYTAEVLSCVEGAMADPPCARRGVVRINSAVGDFDSAASWDF
jgi:hypothetical protein